MSQAGQPAAISSRFASVSAAMPQSSAGVSAERAVEIIAKGERVSELAQSHFEKHRQLWTNRQYGALLAREGERMTLRPHGMPDDRKAHLARAADSIVLHRQAKRMAKIERVANNMLGKGEQSNKNDLGR